jgi:Asp-tRNA(Asn)/Glu-tRNA(Gln) amidotransferase A subunit family amidase
MAIVEQMNEKRRQFLAFFAGTGLSATLLPGALWAQTEGDPAKSITVDMVIAAEKLAGVEFSDAQRQMLLEGVNQNHDRYVSLREIPLDNSVPSALRFSPVLPGMTFDTKARPMKLSRPPVVKRPANLEDVAFWPVTHLAQLIRTKQVSSVELTTMYIARLKRYHPTLNFVVTMTDDLALKQARAADAEIAAGKYRGPLHGIAWGCKDLIARKGYKTTWGAAPYKDQVLDYDATVMERLDAAGAVLVAKLVSGELASGDMWFGGQTKNPWNPEEGSSGSSAGPASATSAGCVGFSVGTETTGSIVGPSTRCSVYGLRPTYGRISRHGAMTLCWSLDKIGALCRSVEDLAIVLNVLHGPDGRDLTVTDVPFNWDAGFDIRKLRVGYLKAAFDEARPVQEEKDNDAAALEKLRSMGVKLVPIDYPDLPIADITYISDTEAAAMFDELTRSHKDDLLARQEKSGDANFYRTLRFVPAVEFLKATRLRTLMMEAMAKIMADLDVYVAPITAARPPTGTPAPPTRSVGSRSLIGLNTTLTNMTGHPGVVVRNGVNAKGQPTSFSFIGNIYGEAKMLRLAHAYQMATNWHELHPNLG